MWGKPDWADRLEGPAAEWPNRKLWDPGTHYKYNDVRVNVLALAALNVWRRPLPEVLREEVMDPIGASVHLALVRLRENSWVEIDGQKMQSVSGGGHWGGGMFIDSYDMARFGYLFLRNGAWKGRSIVSERWIQMARTPGPANPEYGFANWFLNTARKPLPAAPASAVYFEGNGNNIIYVDWDNDIVAVIRWILRRSRAERRHRENDQLGREIESTEAPPPVTARAPTIAGRTDPPSTCGFRMVAIKR